MHRLKMFVNENICKAVSSYRSFALSITLGCKHLQVGVVFPLHLHHCTWGNIYWPFLFIITNKFKAMHHESGDIHITFIHKV